MTAACSLTLSFHFPKNRNMRKAAPPYPVFPFHQSISEQIGLSTVGTTNPSIRLQITNTAAAISRQTALRAYIVRLTAVIPFLLMLFSDIEYLMQKTVYIIAAGIKISVRGKSDKSAKSLVFVINDRPADGTDISWLDDADFGALRRMRNLRNVYCTGDRAETMAQRLERECVGCEAISNYAQLLKRLRNEDAFIYILPTYTAMLEMRQELVRRLGGKNFWE